MNNNILRFEPKGKKSELIKVELKDSSVNIKKWIKDNQSYASYESKPAVITKISVSEDGEEIEKSKMECIASVKRGYIAHDMCIFYNDATVEHYEVPSSALAGVKTTRKMSTQALSRRTPSIRNVK